MAEIFDITSSRRDHTQIDLLNNENTWLKAQNCSVAPSENYNLVNKAYVDELFEIKQQGTPASITIADTASKTVTIEGTTKTVTKSYAYYNNTPNSSWISSSSQGVVFNAVDTFNYGVTFIAPPSVSSSNSTYYRVNTVNVSNCTVNTYHEEIKYLISNPTSSSGAVHKYGTYRSSGSVTATGVISSTTTVNDTVTFTKSFGVVFKDIPTITNLVNCTVSDITTSSCTVTVTLSGGVASGSTVTLSNNYSFIVNGNI